MKKRIEWDSKKNEKLQRERGISFEEVAKLIAANKILADIPNPAKGKEHQRIYVVEIQNYAFQVPYIPGLRKVFLKTIYPCRKATKKYLRSNN